MKTRTQWIAAALVVAAAVGTVAYRALLASPAGDGGGGCAGHGVAACPACRPELVAEAARCPEHGVPEAICTRCRPELEAVFRAEGDWCAGHGVPETQCELCHPGVLARFAGEADAPADAASGADVTVEVARGPRATRAPAVTCATERSVVRFATPEVAERAGLRLAAVRRGPLTASIEAPARIARDARRHARLAALAPGVVSRVLVDLGDVVEAGQSLVEVDSADLAAAESMLRQADARVGLWERNAERERRLLERGLTTERDALHAETELAEARIDRDAATQRLRTLGVSPDVVERVTGERAGTARLALAAPFAGVVVGLDAVVGEPAGPDRVLVEVADTSSVWAWLDVAPEEARRVGLGQTVLLSLEDEGWTLAGRVTWVGDEVDERTRTVAVRAELENPGGRLRAGEFVSGRIITRDGGDAVLVPKAAVQWEGCCNVAFVRRSEVEFVPRRLRLGHEVGAFHEVLAGLDGDETVVTDGSFLLKTELQKGSIGAGCCEVDHLGG